MPRIVSSPKLIVPFAKPAGLTSFAALNRIKRALGTKKVGHTGTLDSFADGLLVALSGRLTHIVPYITACDKTYRVLFYFGKETDTLDPEGSVVVEKPLPTYGDFLVAVRAFTGAIMQVPPVYSAIKQNGVRLSDKVRRGEEVTVEARRVTVYRIDIEKIFYAAEDTQRVRGAVLLVNCSKGTYIRSLVRDIARHCASAAYVYALRRTAVGPFTLEAAAGFSALKPFGSAVPEPLASAVPEPLTGSAPEPLTSAAQPQGASPSSLTPFLTEEEVYSTAVPLSEDLARALHFQTVSLKEPFYAAFMTGKPIRHGWFTSSSLLVEDRPIAVFYKENCAGLIRKSGSRLSYHTVFNEK